MRTVLSFENFEAFGGTETYMLTVAQHLEQLGHEALVYTPNAGVELDRRRAIAKAIELAAPGDAVVVLGRGPLARMVIDRSAAWFSFDDRQVMRELLREAT